MGLLVLVILFVIPEVSGTFLICPAANFNCYPMISDNSFPHYLAGYHTIHQPDGVHIEAHCTCGEKLEGGELHQAEAMSAHFDVEIYITS